MESDDSTVFSDEDDADEEEDDNPAISHPPKLPLPLPPMIQKKSAVQKFLLIKLLFIRFYRAIERPKKYVNIFK